VDPNAAPARALPREDRELFIAANNGHVLAFDNLSSLPSGLSDTLCRLASGGGFAVRKLYTDQDEVLFDAARPVDADGADAKSPFSSGSDVDALKLRACAPRLLTRIFAFSGWVHEIGRTKPRA
jgi:hypothetical protein